MKSSKVKEFREIAEKNGVDVDKIIELRHDIHMHAEGGFKEVRTRQVLKDLLLSWGIEKENIHECAETGMFVDIVGKGKKIKTEDGTINVIAIRTDLDALRMDEDN
jgi:metal-dependent amidase/aminoacylase/carboxypeptidase family protein